MLDSEFQILLRRSRETENKILEWYQKNVDEKTRRAPLGKKEYDLWCPKVDNVEIKEDLLAHNTGFYAFEFEDAQGKNSGLSASTAGEFVVVDKERVIILKTVSLLFLIRDCKEKRIIEMGYRTKENKRALGYLIPVNYILFSPYAKAMKRWF